MRAPDSAFEVVPSSVLRLDHSDSRPVRHGGGGGGGGKSSSNMSPTRISPAGGPTVKVRKVKRMDTEQLPQNPHVLPKSKFDEEYVLSKRKIGKGAFSRVYLGASVASGDPVAIKVVSLAKLHKSSQAVREYKNLIREITICHMFQARSHPNVVTTRGVYGSGESFLDSDEIYIVMEYMRGGTLWRRAVKRNGCTESQARTLTHRILRGLKHCHALGIVHRDIKLSNIMVKSKEVWWDVRLCDFGLSSIAPAQGCPKMSAKCGTPSYMAPEVFLGHEYTSKIDLWSLGVTIYAMVVGQLPFIGDSRKEMWRAARHGKITYPYGVHLSPLGKDFIKNLLQPHASKRMSVKDALNHRWISTSPSMQVAPFENVLGKYLVKRDATPPPPPCGDESKPTSIFTHAVEELPEERPACPNGLACTKLREADHALRYRHTPDRVDVTRDRHHPEPADEFISCTSPLNSSSSTRSGSIVRVPLHTSTKRVLVDDVAPSKEEHSSGSVLRPKSRMVGTEASGSASPKDQRTPTLAQRRTATTIQDIALSTNHDEHDEAELEFEIFTQKEFMETDGVELLTEAGIAFRLEDLLSYEEEDDGVDESMLSVLPREEVFGG